VSGPAPLFDLTGKVAVVTGGSRGLGREMVLAFANAGADVVIASRKLDNCQALAEEIEASTGRKALPVACHVGHWEDCDALADRAYAHFGQVDILVNNAGMSPLAPSSGQTSEELFDKVIGVNFKGPFRLSAVIGQRMYDGEGGSIINVSSSGALFPAPRFGPYAGAKAALNTLTTVFARVRAPGPGQHAFRGAVPHRHRQALAGRERADLEERGRPPRDARGSGDHGAVPGLPRLELHDRLAHPRRRRLVLTAAFVVSGT